MTTPNYDINYEDERFTKVETEKDAAITDIEKTYNGMISKSDKFYQDQINASKDWAKEQTDLQNEQTDFAIEQIEQQKDQANKDYLKEQSGAYTDWKKQSYQYGVNAEQRAATGMADTGYSESAQVSMYTTYQNRVATAREAFSRAVLNYDNAIKDARLQNNAALAEIAYKALQEQLTLSLEGFQYKNQLIQEKTDKKLTVDNMYYQRWQDVLAQINQENALAEEVRQYNETLAEERRQYNNTMAFNKEQFAWQKAQANKSSSGGSSGGGSGGGSSSIKKGSSSSSSNSSINKNSDTTKDTTEKEEITVDMDSVLALGYGPISAAKLASLISQGLVTKYVQNGKYKFKKSAHINTNGKVTGGGAKDIHTRR